MMMAFYAFVCRGCGQTMHLEGPIGSEVPRPSFCPRCNHGPMAKDYSFSYRPGFQDGYNPAVGAYVSRPGQITSALSAKNDEMNQRLGTGGVYQDMRSTSLSEIAARSVDGAMLDRLQREHRDNNSPGKFPQGLIDAVEKGV